MMGLAAQSCTRLHRHPPDRRRMAASFAARTLEFGTDLNSDVLMVPRGICAVGNTPDGKPGLNWNAKYASLGANGSGCLSVRWAQRERSGRRHVLLPDLGRLHAVHGRRRRTRPSLPGRSARDLWRTSPTVDEVQAGTSARSSCRPSSIAGWGFAPPAHYVVLRRRRQEHCHRVHRRQTARLRQSARRHHQHARHSTGT